MVSVPVVGHQRTQAPGEVDDVGHVGEDVVGDDQVGPAVLGGDVGLPVSSPRKRTSVGTPLLDRRLGDVGGRLDAEAADAAVAHVLEQVAVVARDLDDERVGGRARAARPTVSTNGLACSTQESLKDEK